MSIYKARSREHLAPCNTAAVTHNQTRWALFLVINADTLGTSF